MNESQILNPKKTEFKDLDNYGFLILVFQDKFLHLSLTN